VGWDLAMFPYVLVWQDFQGQDGYPMFGCSDTFAVEFSNNPGRNMADARREDSAGVLLPGASAETTIQLSWHDLRSQ